MDHRRDRKTSSLEPDLEAPTLTRSDPRSEAQYAAPVHVEHSGFAARYADVGWLGRGGMGEVRLCLDRRTERDVAVKRIDGAMRNDRVRARFLREARIQAQLDHPTIVPVYDIGVDDEGIEYFTMKRADGETLDAIIERLHEGDPEAHARYTLPVRLGILRQVCQGVEYAHERGIVHRDLKPENVIVGALGEVYVIDWGIAKVTHGAPAGTSTSLFRTGGGYMLGTPGYLAPEQCIDAESVDVRADVYALGAILFELLALEPLHEADTVDGLLESTMRGYADARISARRPDLTIAPELERACVLATKTEPEERLATVSQLVAIVSAYLEGDRDLALRRSLAEGHSDAASDALSQLLAGDGASEELRAEALREAGHALALDPESRAAVAVITRVMATPPPRIPSDAAAAIAHEELTSENAVSRYGIWSYLGVVAPLLAILASVRVHNWPAIAIMTVPIVTAVALLRVRATSRRFAPSAVYILAGVLIAIASTSMLFGPYVIMPALLAVFATNSIGSVDQVMSRPLAWVAICLVTAAAPMALQAWGLLPVGFTITAPGQILIEHRITDASPATIHLTLIFTTFAAIVAPMSFNFYNAVQLRETRAKLIVQMWHLRQLAPR
ncbi:MAG: protein kinase [Myxococcales bacterium]|nr:protein kinase [Myxococcales bacterium]